MNIAKFLILPILKNICKPLLFNFFSGTHLYGPKGLGPRLYDGVRLFFNGTRLYGPKSLRSTLHDAVRLQGRVIGLVFKSARQIPLISQLSFYIGYFWLF